MRHSTGDTGIKWKNLSEKKISNVFRENQDCIPEWLANFEYEYSKRGVDLIDSGYEFQLKFETTIQQLSGKNQLEL